ncbi:hypothetical protein VPH35_069163 [Triticum aestivum]
MLGAVHEGAVGEMNHGLEMAMAKLLQRGDNKEGQWYEEEIQDDLKLCYALNSMVHRGTSKYQEIALVDTKRFGKALIIYGKMQSAEADEFIYHETLTHPPLLFHPKRDDKFDVIVGDLADPIEGGPCYKLYTKCFYEQVLKPRLQDRGIFITQAGPAGVLTHEEVFSSIYNTLRHVFKHVKAYTAHVSSFSDTWGWVMASDHPFTLTAQQNNERIMDRIDGELAYLDGETLISSTTLSKTVRLSRMYVYTEDDARIIHGHGRARYA